MEADEELQEEELHVFKSQRGNNMIVFKDHAYNFFHFAQGNTKAVWRCRYRNLKCPGRLHTDVDATSIMQETEHNHEPDAEASRKLRNDALIRAKVAEGNFTKPSELFRELESVDSEASLSKVPKYTSFSRRVQRLKKKLSQTAEKEASLAVDSSDPVLSPSDGAESVACPSPPREESPDIETDDEELHVFKSQRGNNMLVYKHHAYNFHFAQGDKKAVWRCRYRSSKCPGKLHTNVDATFIMQEMEHNHKPDPKASRKLMNDAVIRAKISEGNFTKPSELFRELESVDSKASVSKVPKYTSFSRRVQRLKKKLSESATPDASLPVDSSAPVISSSVNYISDTAWKSRVQRSSVREPSFVAESFVSQSPPREGEIFKLIAKGGTEFLINKSLLADQSEVFREIAADNEMAVDGMWIINMETVSSDAVETFINLLSGKPTPKLSANLVEVMHISAAYRFPTVEELTGKSVEDLVTPENVATILTSEGLEFLPLVRRQAMKTLKRVRERAAESSAWKKRRSAGTKIELTLKELEELMGLMVE